MGSGELTQNLGRHAEKPFLPLPGTQPSEHTDDLRFGREVKTMTSLGTCQGCVQAGKVNPVVNHPYAMRVRQLFGQRLGNWQPRPKPVR